MGSKTVNKALSILDLFTTASPSWGLRDIARRVGLSHTVVYRILKSFEENGYIFQNPETKKYELGIKFIELGNVISENLKIYDLIHPALQKAALESGESVVLTIADNNEGLFAKIVESEQNIKFAESVGRRSPLYVGASHKVILAYFPEHLQQQIIQQGLEQKVATIKSKAAFLEDLENIRANGWFYTAGETYAEVAAISSPLFDSGNYILGSVSIAGPIYRLTDDKAKTILPILKECQQEINRTFNKVILPTRRKQLVKEYKLQ